MFKLYDYQRDLIDQARKQVADGKNVLIVSPPGSGKSVVISEIIRLATSKGGRVLFLVHRKELIEQITGSLTKHGVDLSMVDLLTVGRAKNRLDILQKPTLIITDESHHSKASTYQAIYDYYSDVTRVGLTATPWRMSGDGYTDTYEVMVEGKSVQWLIENQRLADFRYFGPKLFDVKKLRTRNGEYTNQSIDEAFGKTIYGDIVEAYQKNTKDEQAILYAHSIEASRSFSEEFLKAGIQSVHVDSKTPQAEREAIMRAFRDGEIKVLCNVDLISEGFDVPDCTVTILCRPTRSLVLFLQQSMRSMRYKPGKIATIIDCVENYSLHGFPNAAHDWEKYFKGGWKKRSQKPRSIEVKECPECRSMWPLNARICELCGHDFGIEIDREKERKAAELVEIARSTQKALWLSKKKFNGDIARDWEIAKARAKTSKGNPLYKIIFYYEGKEFDKSEFMKVTGITPQQLRVALEWVRKRKQKQTITVRY